MFSILTKRDFKDGTKAVCFLVNETFLYFLGHPLLFLGWQQLRSSLFFLIYSLMIWVGSLMVSVWNGLCCRINICDKLRPVLGGPCLLLLRILKYSIVRVIQ